ncbi:hypothetical protein HDU84_005499, partial [Entophlyctis sp. JEL0112]
QQELLLDELRVVAHLAASASASASPGATTTPASAIDMRPALALLRRCAAARDASPPCPSPHAVALVLAVALLHDVAAADCAFNHVLCLLSPAASFSCPRAGPVIALSRLLDNCRFVQFWAALPSVSVPALPFAPPPAPLDPAYAPLASVFPAFVPRVRAFIAAIVAVTYQQIPLSLLAEYLNLSSDETVAYLPSIGCSLNPDDKSLVDFPLVVENTPKPAVVKENIRFDQLSKIIGVSKAF